MKKTKASKLNLQTLEGKKYGDMFNLNLLVYNIETDKSLMESLKNQMPNLVEKMILVQRKLIKHFTKIQFKAITSFVALKTLESYKIPYR